MPSRRVKTFLLGFLGALLLLDPAARSADGVFPDQGLEAAVRQHVPKKRATTEPLTVDDVKDLARIDAAHKGIKDLTGLEQCIGLAAIDLQGNEIADLSPLAKLAAVKRAYAPTDDTYIQYVNLAKNRIADVKPLGGLVKVQYLDLSDNQLTDVSPLGKMVALNTLHLSNNKIKDVSPLASLDRLWSLYLDGNAVTDVKALGKNQRLNSLDLRGNPVADLSVLAALPQLHDVFLDAARLRDLAPLVKVAAKDAAGDRMFAPYLRIYLTGSPAPAVKTQLAALQKYGVQVLAAPKPGEARPPAQ